MGTKRKHIVLRVPKDRHDTLRRFIVDNDIPSLQKLMEIAVTKMVEGTKGERELSSKADLPRGAVERKMIQHQDWHLKLDFVLNSQKADAITAVQSNIEVFYDYCGGKRPDGSPKSPRDTTRSHGKPKRVTSGG